MKITGGSQKARRFGRQAQPATRLAAGSSDLLAMFVEKFEVGPSSLVAQRADDRPLSVYQRETFGSEFPGRRRLCVNKLWGHVMDYYSAS
jgi:hypothetical protein